MYTKIKNKEKYIKINSKTKPINRIIYKASEHIQIKTKHKHNLRRGNELPTVLYP